MLFHIRECLNKYGTHVAAYNFINNTAVFFLVSNLKIVHYN